MSTTTVSYNPINALTSCLKRYAKFEGRASRSEFWYWVLATFIIGFVVGFVGALTVGEDVTNVITNILQLALLLPGLAVAVRRLHDTGRSWSSPLQHHKGISHLQVDLKLTQVKWIRIVFDIRPVLPEHRRSHYHIPGLV